jgi:hypothetical protein
MTKALAVRPFPLPCVPYGPLDVPIEQRCAIIPRVHVRLQRGQRCTGIAPRSRGIALQLAPDSNNTEQIDEHMGTPIDRYDSG